MMNKLIRYSLLVLVLVLGLSSCDSYLAMNDESQFKVVSAKTAELWKNKGNRELLLQLAQELDSLPPAERAQAARWAGQTWRFLDLVQAQQRSRRTAVSGDCFAAARRHFPQSQWNKAYQIIRRESGGNPRAKNPSSTASGCFQILRGSWQHPTVGFNGGRFNADANARAARILWDKGGWYCTCTWALTA